MGKPEKKEQTAAAAALRKSHLYPSFRFQPLGRVWRVGPLAPRRQEGSGGLSACPSRARVTLLGHCLCGDCGHICRAEAPTAWCRARHLIGVA